MAENPEFREAIDLIRDLTGKRHVRILARGNEAILWALEITSALGRKKVLIQDQGGWLTYLNYPKKFGMKVVQLKTDCGVIDKDDFEKKADDASVLLLNSMPGYFVFENVMEIYSICNKKNVIMINDASGSIGTNEAKIGDIVVGSFGKWKPVWAGSGGFVASDEKWFSEHGNHTLSSKSLKLIIKALNGLHKRVAYLEKLNRKVKDDLKDFNVVHRRGRGFNVVVRFGGEKEKEKVMAYCKLNELDCTICPRYIRVNEPAVCIELKRKQEK